MKRLSILAGALFVSPLSLAQTATTPAPDKKPVEPPLPYETLALRKPTLKTSGDLFIHDAKILTVTKGTIAHGSILVKGGKIVAIGNLTPPKDVPVIEANGKVVMPGIVDAHVHRGIDSTNEGSDAIVGEVRILDVLNPDAKNVWQGLASGETTALLLHGSANPIGGESQVVKLKFGHPVEDLPFPGAPRMIKFALGENVTRSGNAQSTRFPHTRMGQQAVYRRAFTQAREYLKKWADYEKAKAKDPNLAPPERDLRLETLGAILQRKIWVQCHSYRADEILMMVRLSQEFGFKIGAMQHALESYKVAPELAKAGVGVSIFADEWAAKLELFDAIPYAMSILTKYGVNVSVNTDGTGGTTAINLDAAKAMRFGGLTEAQALALITINPAKELGVDQRVGSIEVGKDADLVIWDGHPLSVYSKVNTTIIDGEVMFQRRDAFAVDKASTIKSTLDPFTYVASPTVPPKSDRYAIVGASIYPVSGPKIDKGTVLVVNGKIAAVGPKVVVPKGVTTIDGKGLRVYPGFIDGGSPIGLTEFGQIGQATDAREMGTWQPDLVAGIAVNAQSEHIPTARNVGVTSAVTVPSGGSIPGQATLLDTFGWTSESMARRFKAAMVVQWPGGGGGFDGAEKVDDDDDGDGHRSDLGGGAQFGGDAGGSSASDLRAFFDKAINYGRKHTSVDLGLQAMQRYLTGQGLVYVRVRDRAAIRNAVDFIKKYKLKAVLVGAPDAWKEAKLLADNKIPVILDAPGASALDANVTAQDWDPYDTPYATAALLKKAGVKFCFMADGYAEVKDLPMRAGTVAAYGLSSNDVLRALTLSAAEIFGVEKELGSIEVGKVANLVVTDGDPFEYTANTRYVFVKGQPVPLRSKFTRLRDQYIQRTPLK